MLLEVILVLVVVIWLRFAWHHRYWQRRGVPSPSTVPIIGHIHKAVFANSEGWKFYDEIYRKFYSSKMCGIYEFKKPILVTWDPTVMKHVFIKDFDHFTDRRQFDMNSNSERDKMSMEMLSIKKGEEWKNLRAIMTPTFTSGKIKSMFPLVCEKADALVKFSIEEASKNSYVDMKKNFGRYTMDTIASCAFGIEVNSLIDGDSEFTRKADIFFRNSFTGLLKLSLFLLLPKVFMFLSNIFSLSINPPEMDFFSNVVKQTVAARQAGQKRGDFLDLLLEARENPENPDSKKVLSDRCLVAQSVLFIIAGYDTTASALAFSSFLLAKNKDQQERVRREVRELVAEYGEITYQGIMEAQLLEACLQETLRLYPPAAVVERSCTKPFQLPGTDLTLQVGDLIQVPVWSLQHDPSNWPDPEVFIPDRFLPKNRGDNHPFTHLPFGIGPRNCIAMRFALLEAKIALAKLLLEADIEPAPGHEEISVETAGGILRPAGGVKLKLTPIRD